MAGELDEFAKALRQLNAILEEATGRTASDYAADFLVSLAGNLRNPPPKKKRATPAHARIDTGDPYFILGVSRVSTQVAVKANYLALVKIYHEKGSVPNPERWKLINVAYTQICAERGWPK